MYHKIKIPYSLVKIALKTIFTHWFSVVTLSYIGLYLIQANLILPLEKTYFGNLTKYASLLFLPHAVRVIAAWLLGPKAILALFPASLISIHIYEPIIDRDLSFYIYSLFSSASAVIAFEFLKLMKMDIYPRGEKMSSWRNVLFAGFLASLFNALSSVYFKEVVLNNEELFELIFRFIIGDVLGLLVSMFVLMIVFRYYRHFKNK
ncbi:MAG: hypothetical protein ACPH74_06430 [Candidatus Puniceispirillum sp.]